MTFPELDAIHISVSPATRQRHLSAISARLVERAPKPNRRKRLMVMLVAAALVLPVAALAAESSVPGDSLYPLKRVFEPVREFFDRDVVAVNRIEELETLLERVAPQRVIDRHLIEAKIAVDRTGRPDLAERLDEVLQRRQVVSPVTGPATTIVERPEPAPGTTDPTAVTTPPATDRRTTTTQTDRTTTSVTSRPSTRP